MFCTWDFISNFKTYSKAIGETREQYVEFFKVNNEDTKMLSVSII